MDGQILSAIYQAVGVSWPLGLGSWLRLSIHGVISSYDVTQPSQTHCWGQRACNRVVLIGSLLFLPIHPQAHLPMTPAEPAHDVSCSSQRLMGLRHRCVCLHAFRLVKLEQWQK